MNILISTTTNWNPGDDFIRYGVKNLLTEYFNTNINWIHYDRNPDFFKKQSWEMGSGHVSNCMNSNIDWSIVDAVVLAGSPEFLHGPLKPLYEGLTNHSNIPLLLIGVGYSFSTDNIKFTKEELSCLNRDNTLIITRQYDLKDTLTKTLNKQTYCLPCPALFAADHLNITKQTSKTLYIPQTDIGPQAIESKDLLNIPKGAQVLCHYVEDFKRYGGYFSSDAHDLLNKIVQHSDIVTNRLHGGLPALGKNASVTFVNSSNRVNKALEPFQKFTKDGIIYRMNQREYDDIKSEYFQILRNFYEIL